MASSAATSVGHETCYNQIRKQLLIKFKELRRTGKKRGPLINHMYQAIGVHPGLTVLCLDRWNVIDLLTTGSS